MKPTIFMNGAVARNEDGSLHLFATTNCEQPKLSRSSDGMWEDDSYVAAPHPLPNNMYPEVGWEDEPIMVSGLLTFAEREEECPK